jgi:hypothetical protein
MVANGRLAVLFGTRRGVGDAQVTVTPHASQKVLLG